MSDFLWSNFIDNLFTITFVRFKLFLWPFWVFPSLTERYQQCCPRLQRERIPRPPLTFVNLLILNATFIILSFHCTFRVLQLQKSILSLLNLLVSPLLCSALSLVVTTVGKKVAADTPEFMVQLIDSCYKVGGADLPVGKGRDLGGVMSEALVVLVHGLPVLALLHQRVAFFFQGSAPLPVLTTGSWQQFTIKLN